MIILLIISALILKWASSDDENSNSSKHSNKSNLWCCIFAASNTFSLAESPCKGLDLDNEDKYIEYYLDFQNYSEVSNKRGVSNKCVGAC